MRFFFTLVTLALAALHLPYLVLAEDSVPTCGLTCIVNAVLNNSTCSLTDTACICSSATVNSVAEACIASSCSVREQLATQRYSKHTCGIEGKDSRALVVIVALVFGALGLLAFFLRIVSRLCVGPHRTWGLDDWVMTLAVMFMVALAVLSVPITHYGLGLDIWEVDPDNITNILYIYFWDELVYLGALPITKISILLFYLKIFPKREIKRAVYVLIALNVCYFVVFEAISIFQCTPVQGAWKAWDGEYEATCRNINMQGWMAAGLNLLLDLAVLILPLPELARLSLSGRKKMQILAMFCVGFFVSIVSLIRLQSLAKYANTDNTTQDYVEVGYWSTIEVPVGIICACMPALRSLFATIMPKTFGTTQRANRSDYKDITSPSSRSGLSSKLGAASFASSSRNAHHQHHIKVQTEWTMRSHNLKEEDEEERGGADAAAYQSQVELVPISGGARSSSKLRDDLEAGTLHPVPGAVVVHTTASSSGSSSSVSSSHHHHHHHAVVGSSTAGRPVSQLANVETICAHSPTADEKGLRGQAF